MKILFVLLILLASPYVVVGQAPKNAPTSAPPEDLCKISGTVAKLAGGDPLRKARVQLQSTDDRDRAISIITGPDGAFAFRKVEPGRYKLTVNRAGFVRQEYGQRKPEDPGAILTLRPGQEMKDLLFRLIPSAVIAGKILDEDGEPLASVFVSGMRETYSEGKRSLSTFGTVQTNDLGEYRLYGLPPGRYFVTAVYPHWGRFGTEDDSDHSGQNQSEGYAKMYYPGTPDRAKAIPITVKSGDEISSIEMLMRQVVVHHVRGHVYNQVIQKAGGAEARVVLLPRKTGHDWEFTDQEANVQQKDGSFDIPEVLPGSYTLVAFWVDEGKVYSTKAPVDVGNSDVDGMALTLGAGVNISGHIIWEGPPSLDASELTVSATPMDGSWNFLGGGARVTQAAFTLKDLSDGTYTAELNGQSKDCYIKDVRYGPSSALDEGFTVRGAPANLEITISSKGGRVQGSATDADGLPAAGVWVVLVPEPDHRAASRLYKSVTTDQYGHFDLRGIAPGDYKLFSWDQIESGSWEDPEFLKPFEENGERISFQEGDQKTLNLTVIRTKNAEQMVP